MGAAAQKRGWRDGECFVGRPQGRVRGLPGCGAALGAALGGGYWKPPARFPEAASRGRARTGEEARPRGKARVGCS